MTNQEPSAMTKERRDELLRAQKEKGKVLGGVILELHGEQMAINESMGDSQAVAKIIRRIYHDRLVGINPDIYNTELALADRVKAYFTDEYDAVYCRAMTNRFGMDISVEDAKNYDILSYKGDMRIEVFGDALVEQINYLLSIGAEIRSPKINPSTDGITHINIYSRGRTTVGRFLSNFEETNTPTPHGKFLTLEGYYHYLRILEYHEATFGAEIEDLEIPYPFTSELRALDGQRAIRIGRTMKSDLYGKTKYRAGKLRKKYMRSFGMALIEKLVMSRDNVVSGRNIACAISDYVRNGFVLSHYYTTTDGMKFPKFGEWLPELIVALTKDVSVECEDIRAELIENLGVYIDGYDDLSS